MRYVQRCVLRGVRVVLTDRCDAADFFSGDETYIAVDSKQHSIAAIVGCFGAHPVIITTDFRYDNSDGSSTMDRPSNEPAAMIRDLKRHITFFAQDTSH